MKRVRTLLESEYESESEKKPNTCHDVMWGVFEVRWQAILYAPSSTRPFPGIQQMMTVEGVEKGHFVLTQLQHTFSCIVEPF